MRNWPLPVTFRLSDPNEAALGQRLYNGYGVGSTHINTPNLGLKRLFVWFLNLSWMLPRPDRFEPMRLFEQIVQLEQPLKSKGSIGHPKTCKVRIVLNGVPCSGHGIWNCSSLRKQTDA